ncbi:MAG: hypothetical protein FJ357_03380 [Thaumarchaeota archaeon]|nr:hypothetical protein [Nitrososphaerota archaeon]
MNIILERLFDKCCKYLPIEYGAVIKEAHPNDYQRIIDDFKKELDKMATQKEIAEFLKLLEN